MSHRKDLKEIDTKIRSLKKTAHELNQMSDHFPALARNTSRILASIRMLEINITDIVGLDRHESKIPDDDSNNIVMRRTK